MKPIILRPSSKKRGYSLYYRPDHCLSELQVRQILAKGNSYLHVLDSLPSTGCPPAYVEFCRYLYRVPERFHHLFDACRFESEQIALIDVRQDNGRLLVWDCFLEEVMAPVEEEGELYLIRCEGLYKIGITNNFERRFPRYVTENPFPLEVIFTSPSSGYKAIERNLKKAFKAKCVRGEWFRLGFEELRVLHWIVGSERFRSAYIDDIFMTKSRLRRASLKKTHIPTHA